MKRIVYCFLICVCLFNLCSPCYALYHYNAASSGNKISGYGQVNGASHICTPKVSNFKTLNKKDFVLYENEIGCTFSFDNWNTDTLQADDKRYILLTAEYTEHAIHQPHVEGDCDYSGAGDHDCGDIDGTGTLCLPRGNSISVTSWKGCNGDVCNGNKCSNTGSFQGSFGFNTEFTTKGNVWLFQYDGTTFSKNSSITPTPVYMLPINEGVTIPYPHADATVFKNDYVSNDRNPSLAISEGRGFSNNDSSGGSTIPDDNDDDDYEDPDDPDDDEDDDEETGGTSLSSYQQRCATAIAKASLASGNCKSNGTITYNSSQWLEKDGDFYYNYSEGNRPIKKWVNWNSQWCFIINCSKKKIDTNDDGVDDTYYWLCEFLTDEYYLIQSGTNYILYEFDENGYLQNPNGWSLGGTVYQFNSSGTSVKYPTS